jgi:hypothetical protein
MPADLVHWINETAFSQYLRESELAFPLTEAIHLIGLGISVGTIIWVDLRLMGKVMRDVRVTEVVSRLEPSAASWSCWSAASFCSSENLTTTTAPRRSS